MANRDELDTQLVEYLREMRGERARGYTNEALHAAIAHLVDRVAQHERQDERKFLELMARGDSIESRLRSIEAERERAARSSAAQGEARGRMASLLEVDPDDTANVADLKHKLAAVVDRDAAQLAVAAADEKRVKRAALIVGFLIALGSLAVGVWAIFQFAVRNAAK
jgi:chromosome segregation ATPase